jgi:hypothetical protein
MATLTATAAAANAAARFHAVGPTTRTVSFNPGGVALSAGDVIQMCKVPAGAVINDIALAISSSVQSYTITGLGDGNSTNRFIASQSLVLVQTVRLTQGLGYTYSADDTIDIVVGTVTSGTAANCDIRMTITYSNDNN